MPFPPLRFLKDHLRLLDQRKLPEREEWVECRTAEETAVASRDMVVRGAPASGIAAAYGLYLGIQNFEGEPAGFFKVLEEKGGILRSARPTAVNLGWAVGRMRDQLVSQKNQPVSKLKKLALEEAEKSQREDEEIRRAIGRFGATHFREGERVLTHCNAGGLATSGYGTALAPLYTLKDAGKSVEVYVTETRPLLQGARLTAWELAQSGIPFTLVCDSAVASLMQAGKIQKVVVGADRIAAGGDTANKIGTYGIAVAAKAHGIPFYVAAPSSSVDFSISSGKEIPIEARRPEEVTEGLGRRIAPAGARVENPAFDVTPHELITAFITEKGILRPPFEKTLEVLKKGTSLRASAAMLGGDEAISSPRLLRRPVPPFGRETPRND